MNIALGGTLTKNIKESLNSSIEHKQEDREKVQHKIFISPTSRLNKILQLKSLGVNSNHKEGIKISLSL